VDSIENEKIRGRWIHRNADSNIISLVSLFLKTMTGG
jgi:hypothetical protein